MMLYVHHCPSLLLNPNQQKHMASHIPRNIVSGKALKLDCWCQRQPNVDGHCKNYFSAYCPTIYLPHYLDGRFTKKQRTLQTQSWMLHVFWSLFKIGLGHSWGTFLDTENLVFDPNRPADP